MLNIFIFSGAMSCFLALVLTFSPFKNTPIVLLILGWLSTIVMLVSCFLCDK